MLARITARTVVTVADEPQLRLLFASHMADGTYFYVGKYRTRKPLTVAQHRNLPEELQVKMLAPNRKAV